MEDDVVIFSGLRCDVTMVICGKGMAEVLTDNEVRYTSWMMQILQVLKAAIVWMGKTGA